MSKQNLIIMQQTYQLASLFHKLVENGLEGYQFWVILAIRQCEKGGNALLLFFQAGQLLQEIAHSLVASSSFGQENSLQIK